VAKAVPVMDLLFAKTIEGIDLSSVKGKTTVVDKLLPYIASVENDVRRDHYLNKLARLTSTNYRNMEMALNKVKPERKQGKLKAEEPASSTKVFVSSPVEEYCLALLVQHPELRGKVPALSMELFENSEDREIFRLWQEIEDMTALRDAVGEAIKEHFDYLSKTNVVANKIDEKLADLVSRLQEKHLRNLERQRELVLNTVAETGGTAAELAELEGHGLDTSIKLGKVFGQRHHGKRIAGGRL
jgi:DNA primase